MPVYVISLFNIKQEINNNWFYFSELNTYRWVIFFTFMTPLYLKNIMEFDYIYIKFIDLSPSDRLNQV